MQDKIKTNVGTYIRTIGLIVASINMLLTGFGKNPIPFSEGEVYAVTSTIIEGVFIVISWWKNNSFTNEAKLADLYLKDMKRE